MTCVILPKLCRWIPRSSVFALRGKDGLSPEVKVDIEASDQMIRWKIGDKCTDTKEEDNLPDLAVVLG